MDKPILRREEKKVEYLELIYDLIFVYIIGRNNSLLSHVEGGFVSGGVFLAYVFCTLAVIQIWNYSTIYINLYGRNSVRDHVFLFVNMYLLYYIAEGTSLHWQASYGRYAAAWMLILINLGLQHLIELRNHPDAPWEQKQLRRKAAILLAEALLVLLNILVYRRWGVVTAWVPILFGMMGVAILGKLKARIPVDFAHLAERAMLYVVFTFGEMIIAIASYFEEGFDLNSAYFSLMAFLIVVGLFLSYGVLYNRIIDRERSISGTGYMLLHVFLIFALNNITVALEFMRLEQVELLPKTLFLIGSFVLYYGFLFLSGQYAKERCRADRRFSLSLVPVGVSFVCLMLLFREQMKINIALTAAYVFGVFLLLYRFADKINREV